MSWKVKGWKVESWVRISNLAQDFNLSPGFQSWEIEKRNDYSGCFSSIRKSHILFPGLKSGAIDTEI
jgi:hypothetical protein